MLPAAAVVVAGSAPKMSEQINMLYVFISNQNILNTSW